MGLRIFFFSVTSRNNRLDAQTYRQGIKYIYRLLIENSKRFFFMLVMKIQRPKILKWKKKNLFITTKKKQQQKNASLKHDTCVCVFDESVVGASNSQ